MLVEMHQHRQTQSLVGRGSTSLLLLWRQTLLQLRLRVQVWLARVLLQVLLLAMEEDRPSLFAQRPTYCFWATLEQESRSSCWLLKSLWSGVCEPAGWAAPVQA